MKKTLKQNNRRVKFACYSVNVSMAVVGNLPSVLFLTFHSMYGISFSLLGFLILVNFGTQLAVDLLFSFFSHRFNIAKTVKLTPILTCIGIILYVSAPTLFPGKEFFGLLLGTIVFSASAGLAEVLISPVIAALPSKDPDREMSKLHSVYAWGVVAVITAGSLFLLAFGAENWQFLMLFMMVIPLLSACLYAGAEIPTLPTQEKTSNAVQFLKNKGVWLCVCGIFLGGAAECTIAQWASGYLEQALGIEKIWGDLLGVALFALMLGLGRSLYAKRGKQIGKILWLGAIGASVCYFVCAVTPIPFLGLIACALTGLFVSMLWPGNLIVATDFFPTGGVLIYALMAAGGDLGASVGPQLVGLITDAVQKNAVMQNFAGQMGLGAEQLGLKLAMLAGMLFPLLAVALYRKLWKKLSSREKTSVRSN